MAVYSYRTFNQLTEALEKIASRFFSHNKLLLTPDEFIAGYINPDHVDILRQTERICGFLGNRWVSNVRMNFDLPAGHVLNDGRKVSRDVGYILCAFSLVGKAACILPSYISETGLQPTAPEELRAKITSWVKNRYEVGTMFADAKFAMEFLNDRCSNAATFAAFFPALQAVMSAAGGSDPESAMSKRAEKLLNSKVSGTPPGLSVADRSRIKDACALINAAAMLPDPDSIRREDYPEGIVIVEGTRAYHKIERPAPLQAMPQATVTTVY